MRKARGSIIIIQYEADLQSSKCKSLLNIHFFLPGLGPMHRSEVRVLSLLPSPDRKFIDLLYRLAFLAADDAQFIWLVLVCSVSE